ncbi:hypothetical protein NZK35_17210 [Stieleria sp. ICT_E10.1]|uniref:hypothetical protein n=1 Tax=Stieleria sedimenti TaxID=2976331 RepID=UPI0021807721|nr:hypothetical protein [Stieleria sedimenti]MCS7468394.1 hypothetical protein [Stieleria sedimenti]
MCETKYTFGSLTRISDLAETPFEVELLSRDAWATGDYVVGEVTQTSPSRKIELTTGRMIEVSIGDWIVGAFGFRAATLESVGSWQEIPYDGQMHAMTAAGLIGTVTSRSSFVGEPIHLLYRGHVKRGGEKVVMQDFVGPIAPAKLECPIVLLIGTSMSSGKTTSAKIIIRRLKKMGLRVVGAKFTGAGRYRDILSMSDAGADAVFDFVDTGLPSTICEEDVYQRAFDNLVGRIAESRPDVLVAEAGASPIEPYNGQVAASGLSQGRRLTVLCASDPYSVIGVTKGFGFQPDLVTGVCTSTSAGVNVVRRLVNAYALNLTNPHTLEDLDRLIKDKLEI